MIKGIFPFGDARIDISDFQDQSVPLFYFFWDFLHGKGNLFFSWEVGSGLGFHGVASFLTLLSPFNIVFFFIKRNWIEPFMTFFVWIKFLAMGFSMCFFLSNYWKKHAQNPDKLWIILGAAGYALSAYSVQYYLLPWLDIAAMFPLLIYALLRMFEYEPSVHIKKYSVAYLFLMTLIFIAHIPQAYMVCFYLILFAGSFFFLTPHTVDNKKKNKAALLKFGLLTLLALAFSAVVFIPAAISIMQSGRISSVDYSYFHLLDEPGMDPSCKRLMLYSVFIPLTYLIVTFRKSMLKTHFSECVVVFFMILPVFVEGTNILWHMGPYICFPMRFGYMMIFTIIAAAGKRMVERKEKGASDTASRMNFKRKWEYGAAAFWFLTILVLSVWLIRAGRPGEDDPFISDCEEVGQILPTDSDIFHKTKLADASLSHNYPMITQTCAFSNYVHLIPQMAMEFSKELGYSQNHTTLSDTGGTLFSDAVLGYAYTFKSNIPKQQGWERNEESFTLYHPIGETEHFSVYQNQYTYPAGLTISENALNTCNFEEINHPFEAQNTLSRLLFGEELFSVTEYTVFKEKEIDCSVQGRGIVYLYSGDLEAAVITVNDEEIPVPDFSYGLTNNTYPSFNNNGILCLGCYEDKTVQIKIRHHSWADNIQNSTVSIGILDFDKFVATTKQDITDCSYHVQEKELQVNIHSQRKEYLFIPSLMQVGWQCKINGKDTAFDSLNDTFLLIPLQKGENIISLKYTSPGTKLGTIISTIAVIAFFLWILLVKFVPVYQWAARIGHFLSHMAFILFIFIFIVYLFLVDIIPAIYWMTTPFHS